MFMVLDMISLDYDNTALTNNWEHNSQIMMKVFNKQNLNDNWRVTHVSKMFLISDQFFWSDDKYE